MADIILIFVKFLINPSVSSSLGLVKLPTLRWPVCSPWLQLPSFTFHFAQLQRNLAFVWWWHTWASTTCKQVLLFIHAGCSCSLVWRLNDFRLLYVTWFCREKLDHLCDHTVNIYNYVHAGSQYNKCNWAIYDLIDFLPLINLRWAHKHINNLSCTKSEQALLLPT